MLSIPRDPPLEGPVRLRTLSKSDFKLARTCDAKLYYRENGYPDNRESDPYLGLLAEGGYMVEALAKARYPRRDSTRIRARSAGGLRAHPRAA